MTKGRRRGGRLAAGAPDEHSPPDELPDAPPSVSSQPVSPPGVPGAVTVTSHVALTDSFSVDFTVIAAVPAPTAVIVAAAQARRGFLPACLESPPPKH